MTPTQRSISLRAAPSRERGAALVTSLILLLILTLVAISGMNTATLELVMAGNTQFQENAFQVAETGVDRAIASRNFSTVNPVVVPVTAMPNGATFQTATTYREATAVPTGGFSMGLGRLDHGLEHQHAGKHRVGRKMVLQVLFGQRQVLDSDQALAGFQFENTICQIEFHPALMPGSYCNSRRPLYHSFPDGPRTGP